MNSLTVQPDSIPLVPVRMLNEHVYCPRLAYLMWVQGEFAHNEYTVEGSLRHRRVYKTVRGYGEWVQLSVFQCRMSRTRLLQLEAALGDIVNRQEDHVLMLDLGPADTVKPRVAVSENRLSRSARRL